MFRSTALRIGMHFVQAGFVRPEDYPAFDQAIARVIPAGQTKVHEYLAPSGDTFWVQASSSTTTAAGASVTLRVTSPTADQWNFAIVELKR